MKERNRYIFPLVLVLLGVLVLPKLFTRGMFMDGAIYAAVSKNLANNIGSFWDPKLTDYAFPSFHEHPPLALWFQSFFFKLFGENFMIEKIYSFLTLLVHLILIKSFWERLVPERKELWAWPMFLYLLVPTISWSFSNNMLENTMGIFTGLSILMLLRNRNSYLNIALAAVFVVMAFYVKGPTSLFPLATPLFLGICFKDSFIKIVRNNLLLLVFSGGVFFAVFGLVEGAQFSWTTYFNKQVVGSLNMDLGIRKTFVLERLFMEMLIVLIVCAVLFLVFRRKDIKRAKPNYLWFLALTGASAIIPIMISPKQWSFYTVPSVFYFTLLISIWSAPYLALILNNLKVKWLKVSSVVFYTLFSIGFLYSISQFGEIGRDKGWLNDIDTLEQYLERGNNISGSNALRANHAFVANMSRYLEIGIDFSSVQYSYYIAPLSEQNIPEGYVEVVADWNKIKLYERKTSN